ncbi:hypothetical protein HMI49_15620 [Corallococcus exercitus]|uniref:Uncharacterized protein n=1 Tax=Corallococcus exercitus TaxID=2316736 RepID=A0A7Y4KIW9_9BACT|nr:hypothetical protein [Corallococcus exercitus]NOK34630.1 hypothetical protein [Corallococcus exercitus]
MSRLPDLLTLDAMVAGLDDDVEGEAWDGLLCAREGAAAWAQALERRQRLEQSALAWVAHPWLADARRTLRGLRSAAGAATSVALEALAGRDPVFAQLGVTHEPPTQRVTAAWGRMEVALVPPDTVVSLRPLQGERLRYFYKTATGEGPLPTGSWKLERGDAPVVLLAVDAALPARTFSEALAGATRAVAVLLLEASSGLSTLRHPT